MLFYLVIVPHVFFFRCLVKAVRCDCGLYWVTSFILWRILVRGIFVFVRYATQFFRILIRGNFVFECYARQYLRILVKGNFVSVCYVTQIKSLYAISRQRRSKSVCADEQCSLPSITIDNCYSIQCAVSNVSRLNIKP